MRPPAAQRISILGPCHSWGGKRVRSSSVRRSTMPTASAKVESELTASSSTTAASRAFAAGTNIRGTLRWAEAIAMDSSRQIEDANVLLEISGSKIDDGSAFESALPEQERPGLSLGAPDNRRQKSTESSAAAMGLAWV